MEREIVRYAINERTGNLALAEYSIKNVEGKGRQKYKCLECGGKLHLRKGTERIHHFAHEAQEKECSFYSKKLGDRDPADIIKHEERIHQQAIKQLKMLYEKDYKINPMRQCSAKKNCKNRTTEVTNLEHNKSNTLYKSEYVAVFNGSKRKYDLVRLDGDEVKYIFEILDCNRTNEESRPTNIPWFEIKADDIIKINNEIDNRSYNPIDGIEIECQRLIFKCKECFEKEEERLLKLAAATKLALEKEAAAAAEKKRKDEAVAAIARKLALEKEAAAAAARKLALEKEATAAAEKKIKEKERILQMELLNEQRMREREKKEQERLKKEAFFKNIDKKCRGCLINNCKCTMPNFINNDYNVIMCINCKKRKCLCVKINKFFTK